MNSSLKWGLPLSRDDTGKQAITGFMVNCFNALDTYGKTPDQIKSTIKMHLLVLEDYPMPLIKLAYLQWVKTEAKIPAPADIANLIQEKNNYLLSLVNRVRETGGGLTAEGYKTLESELGTDWRKYA